MKTNFGYAEVLQVSGVAMLIAGQNVAGWIFCALGLIGVALRFGIYAQEQERKKGEMDKLVNDLSSAGARIMGLISTVSDRDRDGLH